MTAELASSLWQRLSDVLTLVDPEAKARAAMALGKQAQTLDARPAPPEECWPDPAQRERPELKPPGQMRRRGLGSVHGRVALLHAVAHIELNAIDLACDLIGRFAHHLPDDEQVPFIKDWGKVMAEEGEHFLLVLGRLSELGATYGELPAHDGLWQAAIRTQDDMLARLAIAPMVLEARGLDVTPTMIENLTRLGDVDSAKVLQKIYDDEIGHVAFGTKWFRHVCADQSLDPSDSFEAMVAAHFPGGLKSPFNIPGREESDFPRDWYEHLTSPMGEQ